MLVGRSLVAVEVPAVMSDEQKYPLIMGSSMGSQPQKHKVFRKFLFLPDIVELFFADHFGKKIFEFH